MNQPLVFSITHHLPGTLARAGTIETPHGTIIHRFDVGDQRARSLLAGAGFSVDTNRVTLIEASSVRALPLLTKRAVADQILDRVAELLREHA